MNDGEDGKRESRDSALLAQFDDISGFGKTDTISSSVLK